jgi:hypothetical protein
MHKLVRIKHVSRQGEAETVHLIHRDDNTIVCDDVKSKHTRPFRSSPHYLNKESICEECRKNVTYFE